MNIDKSKHSLTDAFFVETIARIFSPFIPLKKSGKWNIVDVSVKCKLESEMWRRVRRIRGNSHA